MKVTVIDAICGAGKTSYAIQLMKEAPASTKFIFVTPFLDEIERIIEAVPERKFKEPDIKHGEGRKLESLKKLLRDGADICTSHALFAMVDEEIKELLQYENYVLIMDEVMSPISQVKLKKNDIETMLDSKLIEVEDNGQVKWIKGEEHQSQYDTVKFYALAGNLYRSNKSTFFWNFPASIFDMFEHTYILTYMFEGQIQCYYYKYHGVQNEKKSVVQQNGRYTLVDYFREDRSKYKELIHIYEGNLNDIGEKDFSLSMGWHEKSSPTRLKKMKDALYNYLRNVQGAKSDEILWTTFVDFKKKIQGNGFSKSAPKGKQDKEGKACFLPFSTRATNNYRHKSVLAFCVNRFVNPSDKEFFAQRGIVIDEDMLALSDMLQWIFRSQLREGKPVEIYIPSKRMRTLLYKWLDGEI
ncbi:DEAD/DEAH box helicase family protein [Neobacillus cucumis]|uniref:DEAD/DEAH box helicase family protein n=1 Tax=Neobacillus cucumis TaxID=1740721 RepID=UPI0018DF808B|nr:DEAD/DEAH box helicase family protein [Neobacillus cucumis]MBI0576764.1 DEAD/DEAH box helicase family protein [Neobacillus cucumis]